MKRLIAATLLTITGAAQAVDTTALSDELLRQTSKRNMVVTQMTAAEGAVCAVAISSKGTSYVFAKRTSSKIIVSFNPSFANWTDACGWDQVHTTIM